MRDGPDLGELRARLAGAEWIDDEEFSAYGLTGAEIAELRTWAQEWADGIAVRLAAERSYEDE